MTLANALNAETACVCLHEGKFRDFEEAGAQLLPFLTLDNRLAYETPGQAYEIAKAKRSGLEHIACERGVQFFGDVAYNNAPFIRPFARLYPDCKFIFQFRDCLSFVSSCAAPYGVDETPVGWPPNGKILSEIEKFIQIGRLQPRQNAPEATDWVEWDHLTKNIWLWAETNRTILEGLSDLSEKMVYRVEFERFVSDPVEEYNRVRSFIGFEGACSYDVLSRLSARPINRRVVREPQIEIDDLSEVQRSVFERFATQVRFDLGYA